MSDFFMTRVDSIGSAKTTLRTYIYNKCGGRGRLEDACYVSIGRFDIFTRHSRQVRLPAIAIPGLFVNGTALWEALTSLLGTTGAILPDFLIATVERSTSCRASCGGRKRLAVML